ncbi:MAG: cadherin-like domain-containing protein [Phaeodactylibacter sp.]|uniref:cadherin-like domain-containing protein n=1 Tax=Phaeodactylibacter sp. TaxID=1940289 RepID=UPI0032EE7DAD
MKPVFTFLLSFIALSFAGAQSDFWTDISEQRIMLPMESEVSISAKVYRTLSLEYESLVQQVANAPLAFTEAAQLTPAEVILPLPDGTQETFEVVESRIMAPELAAKYPYIKAYTAISKNRPLVTARFEVTTKGLSAGINTPEGRVHVEPYASHQNRYYISYYKRDLQFENMPPLSCGYEDHADEMQAEDRQERNRESEELSFRNTSGAALPLRTYRMALACTGEFAQSQGGTTDDVMSAFAIATNRVNEIFQLEVSVAMELIPGNDDLIHLNPGIDPFPDGVNAYSLLNQNQNYLNNAIGNSSFDIGHVFTGPCTNDDGDALGGVAGGTICTTTTKGRGVTCFYGTNIVNVAQGTMAHEIAHQTSVGHSWNNCPNILDQLSSSNAYEPGSGTTIMSYAGACGNQNIGFRDTYYNVGSLEDFIGYSRLGTGSTCGTEVITTNHEPDIQMDYEDGFFIPISTPFELSATATDEDGDNLTYIWEQFDLGPVSPIGAPLGNAPLFRTFEPSPSGNKRVFPRLNKIINNNYDASEVLPTYSRDLTFQFVVRDNNINHGAAVWQPVAFKSDETAGPFVVLTGNETGTTWTGGEYREVTWDVANTTNPRVNCQYVDVLLSVDGGFTYPYTLLEATPNDGSAFVDVPDVATDDARIRVQAANNIFFDINDFDFVIEAATEPGYAMNVAPATFPLVCLPSEELNIEINTTSILAYDSTLMLSLLGELPSGSSANFTSDTLTAGASTFLNLNIAPNQGRDTLSLFVQAIVPGVDTSLRELRIITLSSDFSTMEMLTPVDGQSGIIFSTDFSWVDVPSADRYEIQIATSPTFEEGTLFEETTGLTGTSYTTQNFLEQNELYFWRIRPENDCGTGEYLPPLAFRTSTVDCVNNLPVDLPVNLSNNPGVRTSKIFVTESGTISDINIDDLEIPYQTVNALRVTIISPEQTRVVLFDQSCFGSPLLRASFDDEAPNPIACPPITTIPVKPLEPLSAFDGEDTFGEWTLEIEIAQQGTGGGALESWGLEFCATVTPTAPNIITNNVLSVPPGAGNTITTNELEVQDNDSAPEELEFTIVTLPENGQLFRGGDLLGVGDEFTQQTINLFNLTYVHDGSDTETDGFTFIVEDPEGGWIPTQTFSIQIDEDATVSTLDQQLDETLRVFPNPTRDILNVAFGQAVEGRVALRLVTLQGQVLAQQAFNEVSGALSLNVSQLPKGIYLLNVQTQKGIVSRKIAVQ